MKASSHAAVIALAAVLAAAVPTQAQTTAPAADAAAKAEAATPASAAPASPANSEGRRRAISPGLAASLSAAMPKYAPPPEPKPKTEEEIEAEKPRNQIIRLPQVVVEGERPPVFTDRELYTKAELAKLAARRYLSELDRGMLNRYTLPIVGQSAEQRAMAAYEEEERQRNIAAANQAVYLLRQSDPAAAQQLRDDAADAYIRSSTFVRPSSLSPTTGSTR